MSGIKPSLSELASTYDGAPLMNTKDFAALIGVARTTVQSAAYKGYFGDAYDAEADPPLFKLPAAIYAWQRHKMSNNFTTEKKIELNREAAEVGDLLEATQRAKLDTETLKAHTSAGRLVDRIVASRRLGAVINEVIRLVKDSPVRHAPLAMEVFECDHATALEFLQKMSEADMQVLRDTDFVDKFERAIDHAVDTGARK